MGPATICGRFLGDRDGAVAVMTAGFGMVMIMSLALSVDVGNLYFQRRDMQSAIDIAALAAARDLANAETVARTSLASNGYPTSASLAVRRGAYVADAKKSVESRFVAGATPANAVELAMTAESRLFFGKLFGSDRISIGVAARAVGTRLASFNVGSRLLSLDGGVANALLSSLLGSTVSLNVMDYNALASAQVDMPDLLNAVARRLGANVATYDEALALKPTGSQFANALADALSGGGAAKAALASVGASGSSAPVRLDALLSLGPLGKLNLTDDIGVSATVTALDALFAAAGVARGGSQIDLGLGASIPGLIGATASVVVGERSQSSPWLAVGAEGTTVRTAQTRVRVSATVGGLLGLPSLKVSAAADVASAVAKLAVLSCGMNPAKDAQVSLDVTPSIADLWLGEPRTLGAWNDTSQAPDVVPATLVDGLLLKATAYAHLGATNLSPKRVTFDADDIARQRTRTVSTTNAAQTSLTSITGSPAITVQLKPLGVVLGTETVVTGIVAGILSPVGALLDKILNPLLSMLGVGIGEADVTVRGVRCDGSALIG